MSVFSDKIRGLRKSSGKKQIEIAEYIGVAPRTLRHYEVGYVEPNLERLVKIADFFNVSTDYLLGRSDNPQQQ